ncbi:MAG: hypothetical protein GY913_09790 [Proteobacteria bacterium]|nr:hypothetical protein [Pseudomonadota bacterium]
MAEVKRAENLPDALSLRARYPYGLVLAGGTDVMVDVRHGRLVPKLLIDISGVDGLRGVEKARSGLRIGALTSLQTLVTSADIRRRGTILGEACASVASLQVRNRATLGGAVARDDAASSIAPVLLALDAKLEIESAERGVRVVPMTEFADGFRGARIKSDELLTAIRLPHPMVGDETCFRKVTDGTAGGRARLVFASRIQLIEDTIEEARVAFSCLGPSPRRCPAVERALTDEAPWRRAIDKLRDDIAALGDDMASAAYRQDVAENLLRTWLASLPR